MILGFNSSQRNSAKGKRSMPIVRSAIINKILINCKKLNDTLAINQLTSIVRQFTKADFNDRLSIEQARQKQLKIVTNNSDFGCFRHNLDILTL